jgi:polyhydroxyalkanoate synthesis regulator phasin
MADRKLLTAAAIAGALAAGGVAGAVLGAPSLSVAQEGEDTTTVPDGTQSDESEESARECGPGRSGLLLGDNFDVAAEALGITEDELRDELRDGQTIAEVASAQGIDVQTVIDALVADATTRIDEAVADGDLTQEEADERTANLVERVTDLVNGELRGPGGHGFGRGFFLGANFDVAAEALGITEDELRDALRDGQTIAEVASAQGVDVQAVIDALVAEATTRIDEAVADGDLTQEEADERTADLVERVTELVNNGELRGPGFGPGFGSGPRGGD